MRLHVICEHLVRATNSVIVLWRQANCMRLHAICCLSAVWGAVLMLFGGACLGAVWMLAWVLFGCCLRLFEMLFGCCLDAA